MRTLATALLLLFAPSALAQTVSSIFFDQTRSMDGLYVGPDGTLYATGGFLGSEIYQIDREGELSVFADGVGGPIHLVRASDGAFYATDFREGEVSRITASGEISVYASVAAGPSDIVEGPDGALYVTQFGTGNGNGNSVTRIPPGGEPEVFAQGGTLAVPVGLDFDEQGNLYVANIHDGRITRIAPDGSQSLFASLPPRSPFTIGHVVWANGRLYATYLGNNQVVAFDADGSMTVVAGTGAQGRQDGPAEQATFWNPNGIAASVTGDTLYVSEYIGGTDRIRAISSVRATTIGAGGPRLEAPTLHQPAPNPFVGAARVSFSLPEPSELSLTAYDVLGREASRIAYGYHAAGRHDVTWQAGHLAAGSYLIRLEVGGRRFVQRVVLAR